MRVPYSPDRRPAVPLCLAHLLLLLLGLLAPGAPRAALAHGGGQPQLTREPVAGLLLYAWTSPAAPRAGEALHVTIGVTRAGENGSETPVTDAEVSVLATRDDGSRVEARAEAGADAGGVYYEADIELPAGAWTLAVQVTPAGGESGAASFALQVQPAQSTRWWLVSLGGVAILIGVLLYGVAALRGRRTVTVPTP